MEILIIGGAVLVVAGLVALFIFVERQLAQKMAAGLVTLYLGLVGALYMLAQVEKRDSSFEREKAEQRAEFEKARQSFDRRFNGSIDEDKSARGESDKERLARLEQELQLAKDKEKIKTEQADKVSQATQLELEQLRAKTKAQVDKDAEVLLPGAVNE
jgi:hypothetical protein